MQAAAFRLGCDHVTVMHLMACWAMGMVWCIHHYNHPARCTINVLFIHWLPKESKQLAQSFPNLDMELAFQTPDPQPRALSHTPSVEKI